MKTYIYRPLIVLVIILATASCNNELPFNIKNNPPKLVMNAYINADSLNNLLFLSLTGKDSSTHVEDATVEVHINGQLKETLRPCPPQSENDKQCRFIITSKFTPGDKVRIDAFTDDSQHHAWTEVTVPLRPIEIVNIDTATISMKQLNYSENYMRYKVTFNDRPNETNYYRIMVEKRTTLKAYTGTDEYFYWTKQNYNFIGREDIVLTDGQPFNGDDADNGPFDIVENIYGVFDDARFKNSSYTMTVYNRTNIETTNEPGFYAGMDVIIHLMSLTETEYYYLKSLNLIDSYGYDETISEPIKFPSNVNGGTGMVGISTEVSKKIKIETPQR